MKNEVGKLDIDKLASVPIHLSKLSEIKMMLLKKTQTMLGSKMLKTKHLGITNVATNAALNAKTNNVKDEISSIFNLTTTAAC